MSQTKNLPKSTTRNMEQSVTKGATPRAFELTPRKDGAQKSRGTAPTRVTPKLKK